MQLKLQLHFFESLLAPYLPNIKDIDLIIDVDDKFINHIRLLFGLKKHYLTFYEIIG